MEKEFPVKLITKNKALNEIAMAFLFIALIGLGVFYLSMSPSENSSVELKAFWFIEGVPLWVKKAALYGIIALIFGLTILFLSRNMQYGTLVYGGRGN